MKTKIKRSLQTLVLAFASTLFLSDVSYAGNGEWLPDLKMKTYRQNSQWVEGKKGNTRGFDKLFQQIIDQQIPMDEQELMQKSVMKDDGTTLWSYRAQDQIYSWVDLNQDGVDDVMLQINHIAHCGSAGCESFLLLQTNKGFKKLMGFWTDGGFAVGDPVQNNFKTIYAIEECAIWDGQSYDLKSAMRDGDGPDWTPHACGGNYSQDMLNVRKNCKTCHHE